MQKQVLLDHFSEGFFSLIVLSRILRGVSIFDTSDYVIRKVLAGVKKKTYLCFNK